MIALRPTGASESLLLFLGVCLLGVLFIGCYSGKQAYLELLLKEGDVQGVQQLLGEDVSLDAKLTKGKTYLHLAVEADLLSIVQLLVTRSASLSVQDDFGNTPLHAAILAGNYEIALFLAQANAPWFIPNKQGQTPLDLAFLKEDRYAKLLDRINVMQSDAAGNTVAHRASAHLKKAYLERYVSLRGPLDIPNNRGFLPLDILLNNQIESSSTDLAYLLTLYDSPPPTDSDFYYIYQAFQNEVFNTTEQDGQTLLHIAASKNHLGVAHFLLSQGVSVNTRDLAGNTALNSALQHNHLAMTQFLLQSNANPNSQDVQGHTPLQIALFYQASEDLIQLLLDYNADPNLSNYTKENTLHIALAMGAEVEVVRLIVEGGAQVNAINALGETPGFVLFSRDLRETEAVWQYLLQQETDIFLKDSTGISLLEKSIYNGLNYVKLFYHYSPQKQDEHRNNFLHLALNTLDNLAIVRYLLDSGVSLHQTNLEGHTPLYLAVRANYIDITKLLLEKGASLYETNNPQSTTMALLLQQNPQFILDVLLPRYLETFDRRRNTPLFYTILLEEQDLTQLLLENKANLAHKDDLGNTALHLAAQQGALAIMRLLIEYGALVDGKNDALDTPLHTAIRWKQAGAVDLLLQAGASVDVLNGNHETPLFLSVTLDFESAFRSLLNARANMEIPGPNRQTPVFETIRTQNHYFLDILLNNDVRINTRDARGNTPLHLAVILRNIEAISLILQYSSLYPYMKADIFTLNQQDQSPLTLSLADLNSLKYLVTSQNSNLQNSLGETPLHIALRANAAEPVIDYLLSLNPDKQIKDKQNVSLEELIEERESLAESPLESDGSLS